MLVAVLSVGQLLAQSKTITGKVTDEKGNGISNASIIVKGFKSGVTSETDGTFSIQVTPSAKSISVSAVGYTTTIISIVDKGDVTIILQTEGKDLGTVTTGYKIIKKKDVASSITTVTGDAFQNKPIQSFDQALAGRAAGVNANMTSGMLGDAVNIRVRGVNSISGSAQPLIIVDGVPINQNTNVNVFNSGNGIRYNPLADINPNDIESIDILKDAAASAQYGSRGANGVLVITTKRGKNGVLTVNFNSNVSYSTAVRLPKLLGGDEFNTIQNEKAAHANIASPIAKDIDINGDGIPDRTNWLDQVFRTGISQNYQISLAGGTDKAKFYSSVEYTDQQGIVVGNRLRRGAARINLDLTPQKWFKSGVSLYYSKSQNNGVLSDRYLAGVTISAYNAFPNIPVYDPNSKAEGGFYISKNGTGTLGDGNNDVTNQASSAFYHPLATIKLNRNDNNINRFIASTYGEVEPVKGLKITSKFAVDYLQNFEDQYAHPSIAGLGVTRNGLVQQNITMDNIWNWTNYATYTRKIDDHNFAVTAGLEYQYFKESQIYVGQGNLADPYFKYIYDGLFASTYTNGSSSTSSGGTAFANAFDSYYGNFTYNYKNKYFAEGVLRADAYSGFGMNQKRGYFPGGSLGWRISSENFMKNITAINDLKLRISYGRVGNANVGSYASRTLYGGGQYADVNGLSISRVGDPNLRWESSNKFNIGIDMSLLKNRISVIMDYFSNNITDLALDAPTLLTAGIPAPPGGTLGSVTTNIGSMVNKGFELTINSTNIVKNDFIWKTSFNISFVKNKVTKLIDPKTDVPSSINRASVGKPLGVFYLIRWAGVDLATGQAMFMDKDEHIIKRYNPDPTVAAANRWTKMDGTIATTITSDDAEYTDKSGYPTVFGGLDNTFTYKNFELGIFLQYSLGNYIYNSTRAGLMTNSFNNNITEINTRWTKPGDVTNVQKLYIRDVISNQASTRWLEKGDFLRIREITLGYNFEDIRKKLNINSFRVFASIQNAFIFTKYSGQDPEITTNRQNDPSVIANIANGIDSRGVPLSRTINFGINVGF